MNPVSKVHIKTKDRSVFLIMKLKLTTVSNVHMKTDLRLAPYIHSRSHAHDFVADRILWKFIAPHRKYRSPLKMTQVPGFYQLRNNYILCLF